MEMEKIMSKLIVMCGLPGSGKTSYAEQLALEGNYVIHSSDKIREELGDINDQNKNAEVFKILHQRIKNDLQNGKNVIYDATNLSRKKRVSFIRRELKGISCYKICVLMATPWECCLAQNFARERHVPEEAMNKMYKRFQMPCVQEGFNKVIIHYNKDEWKTYYGDVHTYVNELMNFDQENSHHSSTLGKHMEEARNYVMKSNKFLLFDNIVWAAYSHDIGKPGTKTFVNNKGETTNEAHYYSHHNIGSYNSLFFNYGKSDKKYIALLIELHMKPYMEWKQSVSAKEKDLRLFGSKIISDIELLHEADKYAK